MVKWAIKLGEHDICFQARHSIKAQVLADFMAETSGTNEESDSTFVQIISPSAKMEEWKLFADGASSSDGSGAGLMLINPEGQEFIYALCFEFNTTNHEAEYEALLAGLRIAKEMKIEHLQAFVDSQLVANQVLGEENTWMKPLKEYLELGILPDDKKEVRKVRIKAPSYKIMNGALYRKSFLTPWLRCVGPNQALIIIREMHEDIVGPLTEPPGGYKWLVVAIDYFTKWIEAKPLSITTGKHIEKFVWEHIICRLGIPQEIVSDNGKQFAKVIFPGFCERLQIKKTFTSVYHPQGNGQVEVTNRDILKGLEKRLGKCHQGWIEELPLVLWLTEPHQKRGNGETPYSLVYGTEAVLPAEIQVTIKPPLFIITFHKSPPSCLYHMLDQTVSSSLKPLFTILHPPPLNPL
ncbi:uncharacterized protein [Rutidosis leptorrhynchoides]|uniref:uncharacterized protein n=1 Tax=Rutidosis leptorrhynchoides TaxID=125765 RepID=UPI003A99E4D3